MLLRFWLLGGGRMLVISCLLLLSQRSESFLLPSTSSSSSSTPTTTNFVCAPHTHCNAGHNIVSSCKYLSLSSSSSVPSRRRHYRHRWEVISLSANKQQSSSSNSTTEEERPMTKKKLRTWEESYQLLVSYKEQHGNCNVPQGYKDDRSLGRWVDSQRQGKDRLSDERIVKLDDLGFSWSEKQRAWEESYQLLVSYKERYGNCNVPARYKDDPRLGNWVNTQRRTKEKLSDERIAKLDDLGFSWLNELYEDQWEEMFKKLVQYANENNNGDFNVPTTYGHDENKELFRWIARQRWRRSLLSKERQSKLDKLEFIWEDASKVKADQKWHEQYELLQEYKQEYGHCRVPQKWEEDRALGKWVSRQRQQYSKSQLREDRQMKLEEIGFTWRLRDGIQPDYVKLDLEWFVMYGRLLNFQKEHGHCDVPRYDTKDRSLAIWVLNQRMNQKNGSLRQGRKELLDDIGFTWNFDDQKDEKWNEKYKELKSFKEQNGHLRLTEGILKHWAHRQRVSFANGKMDPKRKALFDEINFRLEIIGRTL